MRNEKTYMVSMLKRKNASPRTERRRRFSLRTKQRRDDTQEPHGVKDADWYDHSEQDPHFNRDTHFNSLEDTYTDRHADSDARPKQDGDCHANANADSSPWMHGRPP